MHTCTHVHFVYALINMYIHTYVQYIVMLLNGGVQVVFPTLLVWFPGNGGCWEAVS